MNNPHNSSKGEQKAPGNHAPSSSNPPVAAGASSAPTDGSAIPTNLLARQGGISHSIASRSAPVMRQPATSAGAAAASVARHGQQMQQHTPAFRIGSQVQAQHIVRTGSRPPPPQPHPQYVQQPPQVSNVPNPLGYGEHGHRQHHQQHHHHAQQQHRHHHHQQQQPQQHHLPQQQQQAPRPTATTGYTTVERSASGQPVIAVAQQREQKQTSGTKPKVVLSPEARQALAKAIWSAIRSPTGAVAQDALDAAIAAGLPKHAVLNAALVARKREALKRQQQESTAGATSSAQQQQQRQQHIPAKQTAPPVQRPVSSVQVKPATGVPSSVAKPAPVIVDQAKLDERNKWRRVHGGVFVIQRGRCLSLPYSISATVRTSDTRQPFAGKRKRLDDSVRQAALLIQEQVRVLQSQEPSGTTVAPPVPDLLDPERFKRIKIEPKRIAKALDRVTRKSRASTAEGLLKQHKELTKAISSHQADFFKYHKSRRTEAYRMAKSVRDRFTKEEKKKEKDADQAERARLAALRSNDMAAYSKLLEDTRNDRLKFLLDKTDECIAQISSLLQKRSDDDHNAAEFATASSAASGSYYASAHLKEESVRQPTLLVGGELKEYQLFGLQWMVSLYNNKLNGILADEMGLGKTIQAIALIAYLMEFKENLGPYLVIVPLSTLSNWVNEFNKWVPSARVVVYKGTPPQRREMYKNDVRSGQFNVLLTTYEYIIKDKSSLKKLTWQYAIVDEGHRMKNAQSKFAVTLGTQYTTKNRILLTGTPLQNNLPELWALLNFLLPTIFNSVESFDQWFNRPFSQFGSSANDDETDQMLDNEERMLIIHRLHELLRPFMLRRVKSEVLDQLPEKVEKVLRCELSSWQKELYKQISAKAQADKSLTGTLSEQPTRGLNNVVMQLRKVCNHPYLFNPQGYHINESIIRSSGKFELLDRMLPKLKAAGHRVLMFTQMTAVMTILEDYFAYRGYASLRLDGSTPADEREKRMYKFNAPDSPYFIFLLSTRAGGLGLNLATADTVIIFDSDWNPMMDLQAQDRAHRIGQRNDVSVFRLITYSPVEEKILSRATEKLNMSELVVEAGKFDRSSVEQDNSMERKKMMEVLLTDFDTSTNVPGSSSKGNDTSGPEASEDGDLDDDSGSADDSDKGEDFNELLGKNEEEYELYSGMDDDIVASCPGLYDSPDEVPDWIRFPAKPTREETFDPSGGRKRNEVSYDDGLTEKQFLRMMDKQVRAEEANVKNLKAVRQKNVTMQAAAEDVSASSSISDGPPGTLTDWTFRKLINVCKQVIALKDPGTKRRLSEVFLEKPDPNMYPDYYKVIEKPIAINGILRKCRGKLYSSLEEFWDDWKLLVANAVKFNGEDSWVANDAVALQKELKRVMKKQGFQDQPPPPKKKKPLRIKLSLKTFKGKGGDKKGKKA